MPGQAPPRIFNDLSRSCMQGGCVRPGARRDARGEMEGRGIGHGAAHFGGDSPGPRPSEWRVSGRGGTSWMEGVIEQGRSGGGWLARPGQVIKQLSWSAAEFGGVGEGRDELKGGWCAGELKERRCMGGEGRAGGGGGALVGNKVCGRARRGAGGEKVQRGGELELECWSVGGGRHRSWRPASAASPHPPPSTPALCHPPERHRRAVALGKGQPPGAFKSPCGPWARQTSLPLV